MAETLLLALAEWSIRAAGLAGAAGALLWVARVKDAQVKLTAWTVVLGAVLLMPLALPVAPQISISMPRFLSRASHPTPQPQPAFDFSLIRPNFSAAPQNTSSIHGVDLAAGLWLLIAATMLFRLVIGMRLSARLIRASRAIDDRSRESDLVRIPITVGVLRPVVILPMDWRDWPERKLNAVMAHELAHVRRRDPLRQLAASIYRSVAWFHPLAWWLRTEIASLAEEASDDAALAAGEDRAKYAEALLNFIERAPRRVEWEGVSMANRRTRMRRIDRVLDHNRKLSEAPGSRTLAALVLAALPLAYLATAAKPVWAQTPAPTAAVQTTTVPVCGGDPAMAKWLNEDVAYLITREERVAFEHLGGLAECQHFVEQFWFRRDPPGAPENEFRSEHYRRIAYANGQFGTASTAGWRTDRGRVYMTYGPPDEIESHGAGADGAAGANSAGYEEWLYRNNTTLGNVLFRFVDSSMNHEYGWSTWEICPASTPAKRDPRYSVQ